VDNTLIPGLRAAAAPVFDLQGRLAVVATVMASAAFDPAHDAEAVAALHAACAEVTDAIGGWRPNGEPARQSPPRPEARAGARVGTATP
jgi:hypothetical protein